MNATYSLTDEPTMPPVRKFVHTVEGDATTGHTLDLPYAVPHPFGDELCSVVIVTPNGNHATRTIKNSNGVLVIVTVNSTPHLLVGSRIIITG